MIKEVAKRLVEGVGLTLLIAAFLPFLPFIVLFGRSSYAQTCGSAASCLLNAATGGPRIATFSAWSAYLLERGKAGAATRVRIVDGLNFHKGHCAEALASHRAEGWIK